MQPVGAEQPDAGAERLLEIGHAAKPEARPKPSNLVVQIVDGGL